MHRDSDNDIEEVIGKDDDHMLKSKGNKKKKSRAPIIVPASTSHDANGKAEGNKKPKKITQVRIYFYSHPKVIAAWET